ncbi:recombinase family protein, partial [Candidatus Marinimicrobia bacterium MT.SAG.4]
KGDTLVVWKLDRLGRSLKHLIEIINNLMDNGMYFMSLQEKIDTTSTSGKLIFHIFAALAEFEREIISERTKAGLKAARARGRFGGRPKKINEEQTKMVKKMWKDHTIPIDGICRTFDISRPTLYNYLKE